LIATDGLDSPAWAPLALPRDTLQGHDRVLHLHRTSMFESSSVCEMRIGPPFGCRTACPRSWILVAAWRRVVLDGRGVAKSSEERKDVEAVKGSVGEEAVGEALADCWFVSKQRTSLSGSTQPIHPYIFQLSTSTGTRRVWSSRWGLWGTLSSQHPEISPFAGETRATAGGFGLEMQGKRR
jgi:hypothetical protein